MGILDEGKDKLSDEVDEHGETLGDKLDHVAEIANEKTGGKHDDKIATGRDQVKDALDGLDGKDDDIR